MVRFCAVVAITLVLAGEVAAQSVQYRSPAGVEYRSQPDTGAIARAERALAADPKNVDLIIALGVAQSGAQQFQEAIATFTKGVAIAPGHAMLYRWRGHRYLSVRDFDRAMADLTRGYGLDSLNYGVLYHLGIVRFARGDFNAAADAFRRALPLHPNLGELAGSTDWQWMALMRAGSPPSAVSSLSQRESLPSTAANRSSYTPAQAGAMTKNRAEPTPAIFLPITLKTFPMCIVFND